MNFLQKFDFLLDINGLSKYKFAKESKIPYTTVDGWFKKGTEQIKRKWLVKIAKFFKVSLDFILDDEISISEYEKHRTDHKDFITQKVNFNVLQKFNSLNEKDQQQVFQFMNFLDIQENTKKDHMNEEIACEIFPNISTQAHSLIDKMVDENKIEILSKFIESQDDSMK